MEYITGKNAGKLSALFGTTIGKIMQYDCIYHNELPCFIQSRNGNIFLVADMVYSDIAMKNGFAKSEHYENSYEYRCRTAEILGYKNFGFVEVDGKTIYWACKGAEGENVKLPRKIDYFQISRAEFDAREIIQESIENGAFLTLDTEETCNAYNEKEKIKCVFSDTEPVSHGSSFQDIVNKDMKMLNSGEQGNSPMFPLQTIDEEYDEETGNKGTFMDTVMDIVSNITDAVGKKGMIAGGIVIVLLFFLVFFLSGGSTETEYMDLAKYYKVNNKDDVVLVYNSEVLDRRGLYLDHAVYIDYSFAHDYLNERLYYDENENLMLYTTSNAVIEMHNGDKNISIGGGTQSLKAPAYQITNNGKIWVNLNFISQYSPFTYEEFSSPHRVSITNYDEDTTVKTAKLAEGTNIWQKNNGKSPALHTTEKDEAVIVKEEDGGWAEVSTIDGICGYVESKYTKGAKEEDIKKNTFEEKFNKKEYNGKICMLWHQVTNEAANSNVGEVIEKAKGVNILCPTWFYLKDSKGNIADIGSSSYVEQCHSNNIFVWGLVGNLENGNADDELVLSRTSLRRNLVNNIIMAAKKYGLDGINIDFEALSGKNPDCFIQFIRELAIGLDQTDIALSVDNYVPSDYTEFYNRKEQAKFADYIVMMGYDEHTSSSESAGSVASMPWVSDGLKQTLKEVPASQLILGIPLYTREWKTVDGKLSSEAIGIESMMKKIEEKEASTEWDSKVGQFYATYTDEENHFCQIWAEEANSISLKLKLMRENNIGGAAFWKADLEPQSLWENIIKGYSNPEPEKTPAATGLPEGYTDEYTEGNKEPDSGISGLTVETVINPSNTDALEADSNINNVEGGTSVENENSEVQER